MCHLSYLKKYAFGLLLLAVISVWQFPSARLMLFMILLLFSVARAIASVIAKHREAHLRGRITSVIFVRNVLIETAGLLLAMVFAGFLGRCIAQIMTQRISNDVIKLAAGIATGLLVGIGVGVVMQRISGRFMKTLTEKWLMVASFAPAAVIRQICTMPISV
jgi:hypothetical protein